MKFKIKSIALGTRDLPGIYEDFLFDFSDYIETAIEYNNDFIYSGKIRKDTKIITRIHDISEDFLLANHLRYLKRSKVDILLLDVAGADNKSNINRIHKFTEKIGIYGSGLSVGSIDEFKKLTGSFPDYISIPINPWNFKKSLVDKARKEGIGIIGYEIFGGPYQSRVMLDTFSLQFLSRFAGYYCDIVCISAAANLTDEVILMKTLKDLTEDREYSDPTIYELEKDFYKEPPIVTRSIHTFSEVSISGKNHIFKNDFNGYITDQELLISTQNRELIPSIDITKESEGITGVTLLVMNDIQKIKCTTWKEEVYAFYRYLIIGSLKALFSGWRYKMDIAKTENTLRISIFDRFKPWSKSFEYILYISERFDDGYNVFFRNL